VPFGFSKHTTHRLAPFLVWSSRLSRSFSREVSEVVRASLGVVVGVGVGVGVVTSVLVEVAGAVARRMLNGLTGRSIVGAAAWAGAGDGAGASAAAAAGLPVAPPPPPESAATPTAVRAATMSDFSAHPSMLTSCSRARSTRRLIDRPDNDCLELISLNS